jgi:DNA-binding response OmpR family regulator
MASNQHSEQSILIVDDNPTNLDVLLNYLESFGFKVLVAENGESALKRVGYAKPDIILLDVMMPGIDGFETCRRLKADEGTKNIPIIFMTALTDTIDKVKGFEAGAVDYITKPLHHAELMARLTAHLSIRSLQVELQEKNEHLQQAMSAREKLIKELQQALDNIKVLSGLLPICSSCKKIRDDQGYWNQIESYIQSHSEALFTHGICPDCVKELYGDEF